MHELTRKISNCSLNSGFEGEADSIIREWLERKAGEIHKEWYHPQYKPVMQRIKESLGIREQTLEEKFKEHFKKAINEKTWNAPNEYFKQLAEIAEDHFKQKGT